MAIRVRSFAPFRLRTFAVEKVKEHAEAQTLGVLRLRIGKSADAPLKMTVLLDCPRDCAARDRTQIPCGNDNQKSNDNDAGFRFPSFARFCP